MGEPRFAPDAARTDLERRFPAWKVWYARFPGIGVVWHASRDATLLHADTPGDLAEAIREQEPGQNSQPGRGV